MSELRPCHCGGNPKSEYGASEEYESWWFRCDGTDEVEACNFMSEDCSSYDEAVKAWNHRPIEDELRARIAELERGHLIPEAK